MTSTWYKLPPPYGLAEVGEGLTLHDFSSSIFLRPDKIRIGAHTRIDGMVRLEGGEGLTIGEYVHIASFCRLNTGGGQLTFGSHSGCATGVVIASGMPDIAFLHVCPNEPPELVHSLHYHTVIGEYAVIFSNAVITPGVHVGDGAIVGAGAVVTHDVPPWEIWAGNPAHKIGERSKALAEWETMQAQCEDWVGV